MSDNNEFDIIKIIHDAGNRSLLDDVLSRPDQIDSLIDVIGKVANTEHKTKEELEAERVLKFIEDDRIKDERIAKPLIENMKRAVSSDYSHNEELPRMLMHSMPAFVDNLAIKHLVSVQPMNNPCQIIYKLQFTAPPANIIEEINDRKISLEVVSVAIEAGSRKFNADLDPDAENIVDTFASNGMINKFTEEIYEEIKYDIVKSARQDSIDVTDKHSADHIKMVMHQFANEIGRNTRRGCGNWVIVSDTVAKILKNDTPKDAGYIPRVYGYLDYIGHSGGIAIYNDHSIKHNKMIIGYKGGNGETDSGYFYCPYMPIVGNACINPHDFKSVVTFGTRYGKHQALEQTTIKTEDELTVTTKYERSNYYYDITLEGLPARDITKVDVDINEVLELDDSSNDILESLFDAAMGVLD